jgi:hypothetical protein
MNAGEVQKEITIHTIFGENKSDVVLAEWSEGATDTMDVDLQNVRHISIYFAHGKLILEFT